MTGDETHPFTVQVDDVYAALKLWHREPSTGSPLRALYLVQQARALTRRSDREITNELLLHALQTLQTTHVLEASILRQRFLDAQPAHRVANRFNLSDATLYRRQGDGLTLLTAIIQRQEDAARTNRITQLTQRLEASTYSRLISVEDQLTRLRAMLDSPQPPWLLAIEGTGGIGKTSLADALLRQLVQTDLNVEIGWVSARTQVFSLGGAIRAVSKPVLTADALVDALVSQLLTDLPGLALRPHAERQDALRARLKEKAHVIVIDNLETMVDVSSLLPILRSLANPTRFILTSRQSLFAEADIFHYPVPQLDEPSALAFVRWEASLRNLPALNAAADRELQPIYVTVGGNPLALRLVVGLTHTHALDTVLSDLTAARGASIENLYQFIYRRAWDELDGTTRQAFLAMPLVSARGGTLDYLAEVSDLGVSDVRAALEHLVALNLVDGHGDLHERRYTIHNLTRTFLHEQVARWHAPGQD